MYEEHLEVSSVPTTIWKRWKKLSTSSNFSVVLMLGSWLLEELRFVSYLESTNAERPGAQGIKHVTLHTSGFFYFQWN